MYMCVYVFVYLSHPSDTNRHEQKIRENLEDEDEPRNLNGALKPSVEIDSPRMKRASRHVQKLNMGDSKDDIHVCIMCMRAIMNNKVSFHRAVVVFTS